MHASYKASEFFSPANPTSNDSSFTRISPSILLIIVILAVIFFISGLLHLLVRYLLRTIINTEPEDAENGVTALQGQLQQLFHLHDAGVDQSFIDALPVFLYKAIIGLKDPFDCAVCLCELEPDDKLRLLPKCSHAFHVECIDTWLLSHSTCPLCRSCIISDFSPAQSPALFVLDSASESSREMNASERENYLPNTGASLEDEPAVNLSNDSKASEAAAKEDLNSVSEVAEVKVVSVKLGKFRAVDVVGVGDGDGEGTSSGNGNLDQRRCFSMGSYEYVMDERSSLQVAIKPTKNNYKPAVLKKTANRVAVSECDCLSKRFMFKRFDASKSTELGAGNASSLSKKESFSISKIWLRTKREETGREVSSRRAFSFRFPRNHTQSCEPKHKRNSSQETVSEFNVSAWEKSASEVDSDVEAGNCSSRTMSRADERPSFARRTLLWIVGKQNKVGSHS